MRFACSAEVYDADGRSVAPLLEGVVLALELLGVEKDGEGVLNCN